MRWSPTPCTSPRAFSWFSMQMNNSILPTHGIRLILKERSGNFISSSFSSYFRAPTFASRIEGFFVLSIRLLQQIHLLASDKTSSHPKRSRAKAGFSSSSSVMKVDANKSLILRDRSIDQSLTNIEILSNRKPLSL